LTPATVGLAVTDYNLETIFHLQNDLINQQKELKSIEIETMEQVKQLHRNVTRLTRKFDEFVENINVC
jgi:hypothetical protein